MTFGKACKFYEDSRCILRGNFCDLDCNQLVSDEDFHYYNRMDFLTQWRVEEVEREIESSRLKLR